FAIEIYNTIQRSLIYPEAWPILQGDIRRCLVRRFPYGVLYSIEPNGLYILAVMNLHRNPNYWENRK
ncbi:MAG TPA: type II toxin-antitoxin system RelE/ParE family toxin, partial [Nitrosomonas sp.]|nr:type II toxin-antitoxin system RelE/ParE family toxin [Nitrosomonas sp.]